MLNSLVSEVRKTFLFFYAVRVHKLKHQQKFTEQNLFIYVYLAASSDIT